MKKALQETAEVAAINDAAPTRKRLAEELGPFTTCNERTFIEEPDGASQVNITSERATREENRRRWGTYVEATADRRELETARSQRLDAEEERVPIHDVRDGDVREVNAEQEERVRGKSWARPGRRRRVFIGFGRARSG